MVMFHTDKDHTMSRTARADRRYKDPAAAPSIVSEKRLTFFLPDETFRSLKLQTGYFQIANNLADVGSTDPDQFPETPSALVREAVDYWLDHFRPKKEQLRSDKEWEARMQALRDAVRRRG